MNLSQAATNGLGVLRSPKPYTVRPDSRMREARRVKSLSLDTMQKPSKRPEYSRSIPSMIIDGMDLLYSGRFDGFCIVSSDSDFTRLASRIRESGLTVYGFGERKTPKPFVAACDKFIYTENLTYAPSQTEPH